MKHHRIAGSRKKPDSARRNARPVQRPTSAALVAGVIGVLGSLAGSAIGGWATLAGVERTAVVDDLRDERAMRRESYDQYLDALNSVSNAALDRSYSCEKYSDQPRREGVACAPQVKEYSDIITSYRNERSDMSLVASEEALELITALEWYLPNSARMPAHPRDDEMIFSPQPYTALYLRLLQVTACDVKATEPDSCEHTRRTALVMVERIRNQRIDDM